MYGHNQSIFVAFERLLWSAVYQLVGKYGSDRSKLR